MGGTCCSLNTDCNQFDFMASTEAGLKEDIVQLPNFIPNKAVASDTWEVKSSLPPKDLKSQINMQKESGNNEDEKNEEVGKD